MKDIGTKLGYNYPELVDQGVMEFCNKIKTIKFLSVIYTRGGI